MKKESAKKENVRKDDERRSRGFAVRNEGDASLSGSQKVFRQARRGLERRHARGKAAASRGCRVSGNGGSRRGAHPSTRAVGPDVACPVPSRERGVARVARWRARG